MKTQLLIIFIFFLVYNLPAQIHINKPVNITDSLDIESIIDYKVDNFICTDTTMTVKELDSYGRIVKSSKYFRNKLQKVITYFESNESHLFEKSTEIRTTKSRFNIPLKLIHLYDYDQFGNIICETVKTDKDSIVEKTHYNFGINNNLTKITYEVVPKRFKKMKPEMTCDTLIYDFENNKKITFRIKPKTKSKKINTLPIRREEIKPKNGENEITIKTNSNKSKSRIVYRFDKNGNLVQVDGFADYGTGEMKIVTQIIEIKYKSDKP